MAPGLVDVRKVHGIDKLLFRLNFDDLLNVFSYPLLLANLFEG